MAFIQALGSRHDKSKCGDNGTVWSGVLNELVTLGYRILPLPRQFGRGNVSNFVSDRCGSAGGPDVFDIVMRLIFSLAANQCI